MTDYCFIECVIMSSGRAASAVWLVERVGLRANLGRGCPLVAES